VNVTSPILNGAGGAAEFPDETATSLWATKGAAQDHFGADIDCQHDRGIWPTGSDDRVRTSSIRRPERL
jgi:hypothetical protein